MKKDQNQPPKGNHPPSKGNEGARKPDPETLGTTDPQEHMEGPVSSLVQKTKDKVDEDGAETPEKGSDRKK